jgi:hypothetical protein
MKKIKILFLAANPDDASKLKQDEEAALIQKKIRDAEHRDSLELVERWTVGPDELLQALNEVQPQVVHFTGHGNRNHQIVVEGDHRQKLRVSSDALRSLFRTMQDNIRLVVLSACHASAQAEAITEQIDCAIGMGGSMPDAAATDFAASLYRAIGFGRSVQNAFEQGVVSLQLKNIPGDQLPELKVRAGVDASKVVLIEPIVVEPIVVKPPVPSPEPAALTTWREKLAFLQLEEATSANTNLQFELRKKIEEAQIKIKQLGG